MASWIDQNRRSVTALAVVGAALGWWWYRNKNGGSDSDVEPSPAVYRVASDRRLYARFAPARLGPVVVPGNSARAQEANSAIAAVGALATDVPEQYAGFAEQGIQVRYVGPFVVLPQWDTDFSRQHHKTGRGYQKPDSGWQRVPNVIEHQTLSAAVRQAQQLIARNRAAFSIAGDDGRCRSADKGGRSSSLAKVVGDVQIFEEALIGIRGLEIYGGLEIAQPGQPVQRINEGQEPLWSVQFTTALPVGLRLEMDESTRRPRTDGSGAYDYTCRTVCADPSICGSSQALRAWVSQDASIWQGLGTEPFADRNLPRPHF